MKRWWREMRTVEVRSAKRQRDGVVDQREKEMGEIGG